jgi:hypothetical protein
MMLLRLLIVVSIHDADVVEIAAAAAGLHPVVLALLIR